MPAPSDSHRDGLPLGTRGGIVVEHFFPADGEYVLNIANMAQALWVYNLELENTLVALLDGKVFYHTTIGGEERHEGHRPEAGSCGRRHQQAPEEHPLQGEGGQRKVVVAFLHRTFAESEAACTRLRRAAARTASSAWRPSRSADRSDPRRQPYRQPRADLHLLSGKRRQVPPSALCAADRRRGWRAAPSAGRCSRRH